jgi:hypothetical protein
LTSPTVQYTDFSYVPNGVTARRKSRGRRADRPLGLLKWIGPLLVAGLLIPALTTQWSDRQKELEIKSSLVGRITESTDAAIEDAAFFVDVQVNAWPPVDELSTSGWKAYGREQSARYREILKQWRVLASSLQSRLGAYFPDAHYDDGAQNPLLLSDAFGEYRREVEGYMMLATNLCKGANPRIQTVAALESYLSVHPVGLDDAPQSESCWEKSDAFFGAYRQLGDALLLKLTDFVDAIVRSNAAGYNVGSRDLVRQLLPL